VADRPQLKTFANRFAGLPVRNSGTLGGNVANGSPIGDSMPLLIALGANVVLMSVRGHRELPLEQLYTGYRQNVMAPDEVLAWIKVPLPARGEMLRPTRFPSALTTTSRPSAWCSTDGADGAVARRVHRRRRRGRHAGARHQGRSRLRGQPWTQATVRPGRCAALRASSSPSATCAPSPPTAARCWATCCSASGWKARACSRSTWSFSAHLEAA
jgi:xanthine dehydrogenase small subunit